uniref:Aldehyde dehydrogenase domain-containing protein n=1 Tax=Coccolithus braarudii TaxID=221442 RepID=A0A7S0PUN9_9EUKA
MSSWKAAPALAAGCSVVLKPSELSPLTSVELGRLAHEAGVPAGVLNVIVGGPSAGAALSRHSKVDKLAFTGSGPTGASVMASAAASITNTSLELGGKSPILVFDDVELDKAVEWVMFGAFWTNGQICSATSRLLVHEKVADAFLQRLVEAAQAIPLVAPLEVGHEDDTGTLGPLVSARQLAKVETMVSNAVAQGAELLTGGRRPASKRRGFWFEPTVLRVRPERRPSIWCEEVFGPVLVVATFASEDEAIALANDSQYGLAAAVLSADEDRARRVGDALAAGIVWLNCSQPCFAQLPWGGVKRSGIGRELGERGIYNYLEPKQVCTYVSTKPLGWYRMPKSKL